MTTIKDISNLIESIAPLSLQEGYDNAGLIVGDPSATVKGVLICLDSTEEVIDEAIKLNCNLVIAHHPIVFSGLKKLNGTNYVERTVIKAIKNDIAIYAAHTNLDNVWGGVNFKIAEKLGLVNCEILSSKQDLLRRLITFCPLEKAAEVRDALFKAGAGHIGKYDECSFNSEGMGTFKAGENTDPYVGKPGERHNEKELKIETIYPVYLENEIITALIKAHPYEEVAYDIIPLGNAFNRVGSGVIGELKEEENELDFLKRVKKTMNCGCIKYTGLLGKKVKKVAVCGGSGSFLLKNAINRGANVYISADFKYHEFFDAAQRLVIADIGHYESEQFTGEIFYTHIKEKFTTFAVHFSGINTNPINYL